MRPHRVTASDPGPYTRSSCQPMEMGTGQTEDAQMLGSWGYFEVPCQSFAADRWRDPGRNICCRIVHYRVANLCSPSTYPCNMPFPESSSPARREGTEPARVNSGFVVEMSRKPAICPLPGLRTAIIHAGDPMLGDMGSVRGNVSYW